MKATITLKLFTIIQLTKINMIQIKLQLIFLSDLISL